MGGPVSGIDSRPIESEDRLVTARRSDDTGLFGVVPRTDAELAAHAEAHTVDPEGRAALLACLEPAWRDMDLPPASVAALETLRSPGTQIVITGQQPALFGGPLLILLKALSAAALARRFTSLGHPTVAVFWVADDDHDVDELFAGRFGTWAPDIPLGRGRVPVSARTVHPEMLLAELRDRAQLPEKLVARIARCADPSPSVWFRRLLLDIAPEAGLLPVHPQMLRRSITDAIVEELRTPGRLAREVDAGIEGLAAAGLTPPIGEVRALPFFIHDDSSARHRVTPTEDGRIRLDVPEVGRPLLDGAPVAKTYDTEELATLLARRPELATPDALLRVLIQDRLFEPIATIAGPTELTYQLELSRAYGARGLQRPCLVPRLRARWIDGDTDGALAEHGIDAASFSPRTQPHDVVPSPEAERVSQAVETRARELFAELAPLEDPAMGPALARRVARLLRRWRGDLDKLEAAIAREVADERTRVNRQRVRDVLAAQFPDGRPAERVCAALDFLARCEGLGVEDLMEAFDPLDERARLLILDACSAESPKVKERPGV